MRSLLRGWLVRGRKPRRPGGFHEGRLAPCPKAPCCVSTQSERAEQRMRPIELRGSLEENLRRARTILEGWWGTEIIRCEGPYLHAECSTPLFGFVDDVELHFDMEEGLLHFRSVSQIGYNDLGKNRRRMERFVREFEDARKEA